MTNNKLIRVLKSFDRNQFKRFGQFVSSPFFNTNPSLIKLYREIKKYYPGFQDKQLKKTNVFSKLYPGKKYNDGTMRNLISDMMALAEKFIPLLSNNSTAPEDGLRLLNYFNQMKLDDMFKKKMLELENEFVSSPFNEDIFFTYLSMLEREKQLFYAIRNKEHLSRETSIKENLFALYSYLFVLIRTAINAQNHKYTYNDSSLLAYRDNLLNIININELIEFLKSNEFQYAEIIETYYLCYLAWTNIENDESLSRFRVSLENNFSKISKYSLYNLILGYENCCTFRIQDGRFEFIERYIDFQKWLDVKNINSTPEEYYYNSLRFINTVIYGCCLKELSWLEKFAEKYLNRINPEYQKSIYHFSYAYIDFEKGLFENSLNHLGNVNYDHFLIKLYTRELFLLIYYEIGNIESAYLMIDSFQHFLSTNRFVSDEHKKKYSMFLRIYKELLGLKEGRSEKTVNTLKSEAAKNIHHLRPRIAKWILEKADELEK